MFDTGFDETVAWSAKIISAYISRNSIAAGELPDLILSTHATLHALTLNKVAKASSEPQKPFVAIRKSVTEDYIVCLEDGRRFKSLKRHLRVRYDMTPEQYRLKWQLQPDYPMVAPGYTQKRSLMARSMGLGQPRKPA
jgi:predicted transcriptional regulator